MGDFSLLGFFGASPFTALTAEAFVADARYDGVKHRWDPGPGRYIVEKIDLEPSITAAIWTTTVHRIERETEWAGLSAVSLWGGGRLLTLRAVWFKGAEHGVVVFDYSDGKTGRIFERYMLKPSIEIGQSLDLSLQWNARGQTEALVGHKKKRVGLGATPERIDFGGTSAEVEMKFSLGRVSNSR